jgi:hypothetical protein
MPFAYLFRPGLVHSVEYRSEWSEEWSQLDTAHIPLNQSELRLPITGMDQISTVSRHRILDVCFYSK